TGPAADKQPLLLPLRGLSKCRRRGPLRFDRTPAASAPDLRLRKNFLQSVDSAIRQITSVHSSPSTIQRPLNHPALQFYRSFFTRIRSLSSSMSFRRAAPGESAIQFAAPHAAASFTASSGEYPSARANANPATVESPHPTVERIRTGGAGAHHTI